MGKSVKEAMQNFAIQQALSYIEGNPEENIPKLMDLSDRLIPADWYSQARGLIRQSIQQKDNWYQLILKLYALDSNVRRAFFQNFLFNATLSGSATQFEIADRHNCNVPWAILLDPTSACNLQCTGCWAAEYGNQLNLSLETIDSIIRQGKELGVYMYIYTGGEPLVRRQDLLKLCEMHPDCMFLSFTNGTLIDESFCNDLLRVKNFVPAISLEGFEAANDSRRGAGTYQKVLHAMELLKKHKLPFGISACYTSQNYADITSEAFFDFMVEQGALFVWFFHYMPVGNDAVPELLPTAEQRTEICRRIRAFRKTKSIFSIDFQNDAQYVGGCIAGGRKYLHINAKGDVEPCVFIHYSNVNIHNTSLLDALKSPLFQAYHDNQPFNENMLLPCPMLENPERLRNMVQETGAVNTDYQSPESVEYLTAKTEIYAEAWIPAAEKLWAEQQNTNHQKGL